MISKATTVFETARVEEVMAILSIEKSWKYFKGLSPFSDERSPSFMVSPAKGIWKDFSSGRGISVLCNEHEHFTYPEAIRYLARKYNIEIEETEQTNEEKQIQIFERVCIWFLNLQKTIFIKHF
jgi:DNA primase